MIVMINITFLCIKITKMIRNKNMSIMIMIIVKIHINSLLIIYSGNKIKKILRILNNFSGNHQLRLKVRLVQLVV